MLVEKQVEPNLLHRNGEWEKSHLYYEFDKWFMETMLLIREAADCQRKRKYNIWKHVIDAHYILCYSIIELSFYDIALYTGKFSSGESEAII